MSEIDLGEAGWEDRLIEYHSFGGAVKRQKKRWIFRIKIKRPRWYVLWGAILGGSLGWAVITWVLG